MQPNMSHAIEKALVQLPDGRVGRLLAIGRKQTPGSRKRGRGKNTANVLVAGRFVRCPVSTLTVVPDPEKETSHV